MDGSTADTSDSLEYFYKEYVHLSDRCDAVLRSSWDDFKLLGAIGVVTAVWPAFAESGLFRERDAGFLLFIGFTGILVLVAILAARDLIKQSLIEHCLRELLIYEEEIRARLGRPDTQTFRFVEHWMIQRKQKWGKAILHFYIMLCLILFVFPLTALLINYRYLYAALYVTEIVVASGIVLSGTRIIYKE